MNDNNYSPTSPSIGSISSPSGRAFEIWSSRVQRELLSLAATAEGESTLAHPQSESQPAPAPASASASASQQPLAPFLRLSQHALNMERGQCRLTFDVQLSDVLSDPLQQQLSFVLDAPLAKVGNTVDASRTYPFVKPTALLLTGAPLFCNGQVNDGDEIDIDCDWTPSLTLADAATHVALKLRETLKKKAALDLCNKNNHHTDSSNVGRTPGLKKALVENKVAAFFNAIKVKAVEMGTELDRTVTVTTTQNKPAPTATEPSPTLLSGGFFLDLTREPWSKNVLFPIQTIHRPTFIQAFIDQYGKPKPTPQGHTPGHNQNPPPQRNNNTDDAEDYSYDPSYQPNNYMALQSGGIRKVAHSGLLGIGSMFQSVTQSAKNLVQETFLMITHDCIIEIKANKFSSHNAFVVFSIPVSFLAKLKFKRQESISFFFKDAPEEPVVYLCKHSSDAVKHMQAILKAHGVKGKHTNAALARSIQGALDTLQDIQNKEQLLEQEPTLARVQEIMDLYRETAEIFDFADDPRHEEVVNLLHKFLARPLVISILDGSHLTANSAKLTVNELTGALSTTRMEDSSDEFSPSKTEMSVDNDFKNSMKEAEDMLRMAHQDLEDLEQDESSITLRDSEHDKRMLTANQDDIPAPTLDTMAELEDMLKNVDSELEELIKES